MCVVCRRNRLDYLLVSLRIASCFQVFQLFGEPGRQFLVRFFRKAKGRTKEEKKQIRSCKNCEPTCAKYQNWWYGGSASASWQVQTDLNWVGQCRSQFKRGRWWCRVVILTSMLIGCSQYQYNIWWGAGAITMVMVGASATTIAKPGPARWSGHRMRFFFLIT